MWGEFEDEKGLIHIVPINEDEEPCAPHIFSQYCPCEPEIEVDEDGTVVLFHGIIH